MEWSSGDGGGGQGARRNEFGRLAITGDIGAAGDISDEDIRLERRGQSEAGRSDARMAGAAASDMRGVKPH